MSCALPPLRPRLKRRLPESSNMPTGTTSTLTNKKTNKTQDQVFLSKSKSISPECAQVQFAPFVPGSYLHPYDSRFVTIQKGTIISNEHFANLDQVQKENNNNNQAELANNNNKNNSDQVHAPKHPQQTSSSLESEFFFGPATTNETNNENEPRNKMAKSSSGSILKQSQNQAEFITHFDGFPLRPYQGVVPFRHSNRAVKRHHRSEEQERRTVQKQLVKNVNLSTTGCTKQLAVQVHYHYYR